MLIWTVQKRHILAHSYYVTNVNCLFLLETCLCKSVPYRKKSWKRKSASNKYEGILLTLWILLLVHVTSILYFPLIKVYFWRLILSSVKVLYSLQMVNCDALNSLTCLNFRIHFANEVRIRVSIILQWYFFPPQLKCLLSWPELDTWLVIYTL